MKNLPVILTSVILLAVSACGRDGYQYTGYADISPCGWAYGEPFRYTLDLPDSLAAGRLLVTLTHDNTYEYRNLWLEVSYDTPAGHHVDTVNVDMCDVYGKWYGKGLPGCYQLTDTLTPRETFVDSSVVTLRHIMRVDTVTGLDRIGIAFVK